MVYVGDFNAVTSASERRGINDQVSPGVVLECQEFKGFLDDMFLFDLPLLGRKFTWFLPNGPAMSRLDRILLSEGWL